MVNLVELLKMTVSELRELARKYVGRGHSRLKTKGELISALKKIVSAPKQKTVSAKPKKRSPAKPRSKKTPKVRATRETSTLGPVADIVPFRRQPEPLPRSEFRVPAAIEMRRPTPLVEAFFVGAQPPPAMPRRVGGSHSTQSSIDVGYGTDQVVALPREPRTLFVFWDLAPSTLQAASEGLRSWRLILRVCVGQRILGERPVDLAHGRAYLEDIPLAPGARVELHVVDDKTSRQVAASEIPDSFGTEWHSRLRLAEIPWQLPLTELPKATQAGQVRIREETADAARVVRARVGALGGGSSPVAPWGAAPGRRLGLPSSR
jgi:hypothetical protein